MIHKSINHLKKTVALSGLPDDHLQWIADHSGYREFEDGEVIAKKGDAIETMWFIPEGRFDFYMDVNGQLVHYYSFQNDTISGGVEGMLPYSRMKLSPGNAYSIGKTKMYTLHKKYFRELEKLNPVLIQQLIGYMTERAKSFATTQLRHEKVSALGKLAAGIAHEMNNPASAINRISSELSKRLIQSYILFEKLLLNKISPETFQKIRLMIEEKKHINKKNLSPMELMDGENEINDWLQKRQLAGNNIAVEAFAEARISGEDLESIRCEAGNEGFIHVLQLVENLLISGRIVKDMEEASTRISNLVGAIKSHVNMDRTNDLQPTDIHRDIENTLTLMGYRLREKNITVKKRFSPDIPVVPAYVAELNQVWTNIIDNAIYALPNGGELMIETTGDNKSVYVKIIDNGSGISPEILSRIFDPFFTTKKVGEGTGIGLDLVKRIIKHHEGEIKVNSKPGRTEFIVFIPKLEINKN